MLQIGIQSGKAWTGLGLEEGLERKKKRMQDAILGFRSIHLVPSGRAQKSVHEKGNTGTGRPRHARSRAHIGLIFSSSESHDEGAVRSA